jgi:hypothetical protein
LLLLVTVLVVLPVSKDAGRVVTVGAIAVRGDGARIPLNNGSYRLDDVDVDGDGDGCTTVEGDCCRNDGDGDDGRDDRPLMLLLPLVLPVLRVDVDDGTESRVRDRDDEDDDEFVGGAGDGDRRYDGCGCGDGDGARREDDGVAVDVLLELLPRPGDKPRYDDGDDDDELLPPILLRRVLVEVFVRSSVMTLSPVPLVDDDPNDRVAITGCCMPLPEVTPLNRRIDVRLSSELVVVVPLAPAVPLEDDRDDDVV